MPRVRYCVVNQAIANLFSTYGYSPTVLGGLYSYTAADFDAAQNAVWNAVYALIDDDDLTNDDQAYAMQDTMEAGYTELFWSTEGKFWY